MLAISKLKMSTRFLLLTLLLVLVVIVESALVIVDINTVNRQAIHEAETEIPILSKAHQLKLSVVQVQQWLTDISATRGLDGLNDGFDEAENNAKIFRQLIEELTILDAANAERYQAMLPVFNAYYETGKGMAQSYVDEGPAGGNQMMASFDEVAANLADEVDGFLAEVERRTSDGLESQIALAESTRLLMFIGTAIILLGIGLVYLIMSQAMSCLPKVLIEVNKIAKGDLTSTIEVRGNDEFAELMRGLQAMQNHLLEVISKINSTTLKLSEMAQQVSELMADTSSNIENQQQETRSISNAMGEMDLAVAEVSRSVTEASAIANDANEETGNGRKIVDDTVTGIKLLSTKIEETAKIIEQVSEDSKNINQVLDVIKGVAEQTNLLALNAAIEAARAGEQGRGFAVVADEVRTLAGRTQQSTQEIEQIIEKLQSGAFKSVEAMTQSREQTQNVVDQAVLAGASLMAIAKSVSHIDEMSTKIASSAQQQTTVTTNMKSNINRIGDMTNQTSQVAKQSSSSGLDLSRIATELKSLVQAFRV